MARPAEADSSLDSVAAADVNKEIRADVAASALKGTEQAMPQGTQETGKSLIHMLFLAAALSLLSALVRRERRQLVHDGPRPAEEGPRRPEKDRREPCVRDALLRGRRALRRRGNGVVQLIDPTSDVGMPADTTTDTTTTEASSAVGDPQDPATQPPALAAGAGP